MTHALIHSQRFGYASSQESRYHGLKNQGATSNLNSVLQVLFMTKDFRDAVKRCSDDCGDFADQQLNSLFENLKKHKAETVEITQKLGIDKVDEEHDAAEYLEKILTQTSDEASQIFKGELVHRTVCDCGAVTDEKKPFWNLPLPLRSSSERNYSVIDGIEEFFKVSHLNGGDQLFCEKCQSKRDSTARCVIQHHPDVLMLLLKRFEFNYRHMSYVKNSCFVEVPLTIEIPENHKYELYAFVDHFGHLKKGHYTATIKSKEDEDIWYNFNDSSVTKTNQPFKGHMLEKSSSAYLLFYRKIKGSKEAGTKEDREVSNYYGPPTDNKYGTEVEDHWKKEKMRAIYNIFVRGLKGETFPIDLCNSEEDLQKVTVKDLKKKIFEICPKIRDEKNLQLKFFDKTLEGQTLLAKYGIKDTSVIHMVYSADEEKRPVEKQDGGMGDKEGNTRRSMEDVRLSDFQTQTTGDKDGQTWSMENFNDF